MILPAHPPFVISTVIRTETREPVVAFERATLGGAFEVFLNGYEMDEVVPPSKISDLRRGEFGGGLEMLFTAVGENMQTGNGKE